MGDRTQIQITCSSANDDIGKINVIFDEDYDSPGEPATGIARKLYFDEMNYGGQELIEKCTADGIVFFGWHGGGTTYLPSVFVSDGKRLYQCDAYPDNPDVLLVRLDKDGLPLKEDLIKAAEYRFNLPQVEKKLGFK